MSGTKTFIDSLIKHIKANADKIAFNNKMFEIMEGDLLKYISIALRDQLNPESADLALKRVAPINVWNKINRKLSTLYSKDVTRTTALDSDQELIQYYVKGGLNKHFGNFNENYNAYKWSSLEIYEDEKLKRLNFRSIPSNQFLPFSFSTTNPLRPEGMIRFMGTQTDASGVIKNKFFVYTDEFFISFLDDGTILNEDLIENGGKNPFGVVPIEYGASSEYLLIPTPDKDSFQMTILIPILITDQNYASMYLSFPILYTLDADSENLPKSPNIFWNLKSDNPEKSANVGVVKAEPDLQAQMDHTLRQLAIWMDSKDIKPGTIGKTTAENFASGLSKIISEADTTQNRKNQEVSFKEIEFRFWKRLAKMHNTLAGTGRLENRKTFSDPEKLEVMVEYSQDKVIETREDLVRRLKLEKDSGFISNERAIRKLNPSFGDDEIKKLLAEIDAEKSTTIITEVEEVPESDN